MVIDLERLSQPQAPEALTVEEVKTPGDLAIWQEVFAVGYEVPLEISRLIAPVLKGDMKLFIAKLEGEPVGTTGLFEHAGVPGIYCVSTVPGFRGKGIGTAIAAAPLIQAKARGYRVGTLQASTMGYRVYKRLGFEEICFLRVFGLGLS